MVPPQDGLRRIPIAIGIIVQFMGQLQAYTKSSKTKFRRLLIFFVFIIGYGEFLFTESIFIYVITAYNDEFLFAEIMDKPVIKIITGNIKIGAGFIEQ